MMTTKIEWTDEVWNPVTGCTKVSAGCKNCYAERLANRFWGDRKFTDVQCHEDRLDIPLKWRKPRQVFVNSMSDLFNPDVPDSFIREVFWTMQRTSWHTYQILTKRPKALYGWIDQVKGPTLPNVWLGVSVENQETADERIPWLLKTPAAIRFVSYEPALGPVDFNRFISKNIHSIRCNDGRTHFELKKGNTYTKCTCHLDWIIAGGESGPGARPAHPDWFRSVRDQCLAAGVPFFFKQWGEWHYDPIYPNYPRIYMDQTGKIFEYAGSDVQYRNGRLAFDRVGKKRAGRLLDGREWNEYP